MQYAKLMDGQLIYAPRKMQIEIGEEPYIVYNPPADMLAADGWLPLVFTDMPDDAPEGYEYVPDWDEFDGVIERVWDLVEAPDDISDAEALTIIMGGSSNDEN